MLVLGIIFILFIQSAFTITGSLPPKKKLVSDMNQHQGTSSTLPMEPISPPRAPEEKRESPNAMPHALNMQSVEMPRRRHDPSESLGSFRLQPTPPPTPPQASAPEEPGQPKKDTVQLAKWNGTEILKVTIPLSLFSHMLSHVDNDQLLTSDSHCYVDQCELDKGTHRRR